MTHRLTFRKHDASTELVDIEIALKLEVAEAAAEAARNDDEAVVDVALVDKVARRFKKLIHSYDYTFDGNKGTLVVVFKHLLKKLNVTQKYVQYDVEVLDGRKIVFTRSDAAPHPLVTATIPAPEFLPIKNLVLFFEMKTAPPDPPRLLVKVLYKRVAAAAAAAAESEGAAGVDEEVEEIVREMFESTFAKLCGDVSVHGGNFVLGD